LHPKASKITLLMVEAVDSERQWMEHQPQEGRELAGMDVERDVGR